MLLNSNQAKQQLWKKGLTIKQWADSNGFSERAVRAVLSGHNKGNYAKAHEISVALGIKTAT